MPGSSALKEAKKDEEAARNLVNCKITNALLLLSIKQNKGSPEEKILERMYNLVEIVQSADTTFQPLLRDPKYYTTEFNDDGIRLQLRSQVEHEWILNPSWEGEAPVYGITELGKEKLEEWTQELPIISTHLKA